MNQIILSFFIFTLFSSKIMAADPNHPEFVFNFGLPPLSAPIVNPYTINPPMAPWAKEAYGYMGEVMKKFFMTLTTDTSGIEHPNPDENEVDQYIKKIGDSNFGFIVEGIANLHFLGGPYFFNELGGGVGFSYDWSINTLPGVVVSFRISPLSVEFAWIRVGYGSEQIAGLPREMFLGPQLNLEISKQFNNAIIGGFRIYERPQIDVEHTQDTGWVSSQAFYLKLDMNKLVSKIATGTLNSSVPRVNLMLVPSHINRGDSYRELYQWQNPYGVRSIKSMEDVYQGMVWLDVKF